MITLASLAALSLGLQTPSINDVLVRNFQDVSFTARKKTGIQRELAKINRDFGQSYRFDFTNVRMKEPLMLRLDSQVEDTKATMILNGTTQLLTIPGFRQKQDLSRAPGRRQTALDFGILTPSLFKDLFNAEFVRIDRASGDYVFDLTFKDRRDTTRHRVWVDPEKKFTTKREWYNQPGRQIATFFYDAPKHLDGVWVPTRLTVKNMDNKVAGVTEYENVRVNSGIPDSIFKID
jgi:outer membrane lipoprotein-sorting protein